MTARYVLVTGTDTGVGKTVVTAALAAALAADGGSVAVDKPTQTGVAPGEPGDAEEIRRLSAVAATTTGIRLAAPMAPVAAAGREGVTLPDLDAHVRRIRRLGDAHRVVLVEGAGGVLVALDPAGRTLADLAGRIGRQASVVVVCRSGLGTLNHTALTLEALQHRGVRCAGVVIGAWPHAPGEVDLDNREVLGRGEVPLLGAVPDGASRLPVERFRQDAPTWFTAPLEL